MYSVIDKDKFNTLVYVEGGQKKVLCTLPKSISAIDIEVIVRELNDLNKELEFYKNALNRRTAV